MALKQVNQKDQWGSGSRINHFPKKVPFESLFKSFSVSISNTCQYDCDSYVHIGASL